MSSIVIAGDTSGTVTLDAPAVAGTTVLTLPATSGTVVTTATSSGISGSAITTGTVGVSVGGTGANTLTANNVILGNGTSAVQFVAPGSNGNVLTSNGTTWTSAAAGGGQLQTAIFTAPGTWTKPASCTQVRVTVVGGGGGSGNTTATQGGSGGTSSFGPAVSCTGGVGGGGNSSSVGAPGTGTVSVGTAIRTTHAGAQANGILNGLIPPSSPTAGQAFSTTTNFGAGRGGGRLYNDVSASVPIYAGGNGGVAIAIVPVSAPVSITIGSGGNTIPSSPAPGVGGAILVEFIG